MHEYQTIEYENNECFSKGICSVNPILSSLNEVILLYLKGLSFYLLRLKNMGVTNASFKESISYTLFNIITGAEYSQDQFHDIILKLYNYIAQSKILYEKLCFEKNIEIETSKSYFKFSKSFNLSDAIRKGEKYFLKKSHHFSTLQKDLYDIVIFLIKSISIKMLELQKLNEVDDEAYYTILELLNTLNSTEFSEERVIEEIEKSILKYYNAAKNVFYRQIELYGQPQQVEVSFSAYPGKAILVSGSDLKKLELVLKECEGKEINVYTHGLEMLVAHSFPKFHSHPNLKGHFGTGMESSLIDFASFPGAILMTKATLQKIEYLYRGRLFTLDPIPPPGTVKIKNSNFEPLIKSALDAKGFTHTQEKPAIQVGFNKNELISKINNIIDKIIKGEIKNFYIVGLLNYPNLAYKPYFEQFFELMPQDCFVFSLCCPINTDKVYHLDSFYDYSLFYIMLKEIKSKIPLESINISIFLTRCDKHTISNLLYLKHIGIKNIYMCKCPQSLINPSLLKTLQETFNIKEMSTPEEDLKATLKKGE